MERPDQMAAEYRSCRTLEQGSSMSHEITTTAWAAVPAAGTRRSTSDVVRFVDLTQHEIQALKTRYNLADAHTHQRQSPTQDKIVQRLPDLWYESEDNRQDHHERRFLETFFRLHKQPTAAALDKTLLSYSASVSTMVAGLYCAQRQKSVALVEPCFDNLVDVLKHMRTPLVPLPEHYLSEPDAI